MHRWLTAWFVVCVGSTPAAAQPKVIVEIRASIPAEGGRRLPVIGRFWLVWARDSVPIITNAQGVGRAEASAGSYRVRSYQGVGVGALKYYWDVPVGLTRGMLLELSERNAQPTPATGPVSAILPEEGPATSIAAPALPDHAPASIQATLAAPPPPFRQPGDPGYKDPNVGTLFGVLVPGGGHLYAGEVGKGLGILAVGGLGASLLVSQLSCGGSEACDGPMIGFGALLYLGGAIYSIVDAAPAARRANQLVPEFAVRFLPQGRLGVGLEVPLP